MPRASTRDDDYATLFTPRDAAFDAPRRSSVLVDDWQVSGKLLTPDDGDADGDPDAQLQQPVVVSGAAARGGAS